LSGYYESSKVGAPKKGEDVFLNPDETAFVQRILSRPETIPQAFWTAVIQKIGLDGLPIPQSQVQGLQRLQDQVDDTIQAVEDAQITTSVATTVTTLESTGSGTYGSLSTVGPGLTGLLDGVYILAFGAHAVVSNSSGFMSPSTNAATPSDNDGAFLSSTGDVQASIMRALPVTLSNSNNSSVVMEYRASFGASISFANRWLFALRYGNA
jgi:hypothetical protein